MAAVAVVSSDGGRDGSSLFAIHLIEFHVIYANMIYASSLAALVAVNCRCNDYKGLEKLIPALH